MGSVVKVKQAASFLAYICGWVIIDILSDDQCDIKLEIVLEIVTGWLHVCNCTYKHLNLTK